jgi:tetratricopeptide (TPR) repeat protein
VSLIIDAIKKAQQLRLRELKGAPFLRGYVLKSSGIDSGRKIWSLLSIIGSGVLVTVLLLLWGDTLLSPFVSSQSRGSVIVQRGAGSERTQVSSSFRILSSREDSTVRIDKKLSPGVFFIDVKEASQLEQKKAKKKKKESDSPIAAEERETPPVRLSEAVEEGERSSPTKSSAGTKGDEPFLTQPPRTVEDIPSKPMGLDRQTDKGQTSVSEATALFNQGVDFYRKRNNGKAIQAYEKVIQLDPTFIEAHNNLGVLYQEMGLYDKALEVFQKAIQINPRYEKIFNNLGTLLLLRERYEESKEAFRKALIINPNNIESHINLGILFKKQGQMDQAIGSYQKALSLNPLHGETHYNMGLLYEHLEKWDLAIHHYQTFIELSLRTHPDLVGKVQRHLSYLKTKGIKK